jgi:hypothetical protein
LHHSFLAGFKIDYLYRSNLSFTAFVIEILIPAALFFTVAFFSSFTGLYGDYFKKIN